MTQTIQTPPLGRAQTNGSGDSSALQLRRRRRKSRAVLAVVGLALLGGAVSIFETLVPRAPHTQSVLVAARPIRAGAVIRGADLAVADLASAQVSAVPITERDGVVGHTAAFDVAPGQPLVAADVGAAPGPAPGEAVIGLSLAAGRLPDSLAPGNVVIVVATAGRPAAGASATSGAGGSAELARGRVFAVGRSPDGTRTDVSLVLPAVVADGVAQAAALDQVSLLWVNR